MLKVSAVTSPGEIDFRPGDVLLLTVKSQDTDAALRDLHNVEKDIPIFCLQNGVRNEETAAGISKGFMASLCVSRQSLSPMGR